ncbi:hypothetical protein Lgee_0079 [Legionella geestiana]|uniref:Uncharacterized protein n=1 Tax=Legionella geestiana TaxID=45065 RepID=A0A0W0UA54_9GAMM|nr:hypothetical protein [Legionella geestiana]KTD04682.1 hypothetical protein Lgee_0079 [Legionella geestiana]QBS11970.1 hypothetical protein E4T54_03955 [Legionella geestiana]STX53316.1 Uncharacterised protein [Legionella geestiana]
MTPPLSQTLLSLISEHLHRYTLVSLIFRLLCRYAGGIGHPGANAHKEEVALLLAEIARGVVETTPEVAETSGVLLETQPVDLAYVINRLREIRQMAPPDDLFHDIFLGLQRFVSSILVGAHPDLFPSVNIYHYYQKGIGGMLTGHPRDNTRAFLDALEFITMPDDRHAILLSMKEHPDKLYRLIVDFPMESIPLLIQEFKGTAYGILIRSAKNERALSALVTYLQALPPDVDKSPWLLANHDEDRGKYTLLSCVLERTESLPLLGNVLCYASELQDETRYRVLQAPITAQIGWTILRNDSKKQPMLQHYLHTVLAWPEVDKVSLLGPLVSKVANLYLNLEFGHTREAREAWSTSFMRMLVRSPHLSQCSEILTRRLKSSHTLSLLESITKVYPDLLKLLLDTAKNWPITTQAHLLWCACAQASTNRQSARHIVDFVLDAGESQSDLLAISGSDGWNLLHLAAMHYPLKARILLEAMQNKIPGECRRLLSATTHPAGYNPLMLSIVHNDASVPLFLRAIQELPCFRQINDILTQVGVDNSSPLKLSIDHGQAQTTGKMIRKMLPPQSKPSFFTPLCDDPPTSSKLQDGRLPAVSSSGNRV